MQAEKKDEPMPDASAAQQEAAPAENGTADAAAAEHSAAPAAESADTATPMETEAKDSAEVVKKKRSNKHSVPYKAQGVAALSDKAVQVFLHQSVFHTYSYLSQAVVLCLTASSSYCSSICNPVLVSLGYPGAHALPKHAELQHLHSLPLSGLQTRVVLTCGDASTDEGPLHEWSFISSMWRSSAALHSEALAACLGQSSAS